MAIPNLAPTRVCGTPSGGKRAGGALLWLAPYGNSEAIAMTFPTRETFAQRRNAVFDAMAAVGVPSVAVIPSAPVHIRNNDVEHDYRQDSDLYYLTGFDEPRSVLVLTFPERKATMFVRPRDVEREIWDGPRAGVDGVKSDFGIDEAFVIAELKAELANLLQNKTRLYYRLGRERDFDDRIFDTLDTLRVRGRRGGTWPTEIIDPATVLHEMRLFKSDEEIAVMRKAAAITGEAHEGAMARAKAGMYEYEVESYLLETFRKHGAERAAYGSIVGSGPNATILHYRSNNRRMEEGDLLLIDAGCEYGYYASDVTRTFPVGKGFRKEQQAIYELVLEAQLATIDATRVGATLEDLHAVSVRVLTKGLVTLGLLEGDVDTLITEEKYKPFYMHRTCHWLGMDVHDVGAYFHNGEHRRLEPGMVTTVEPGIYIGRNEERVAPEWRGIGVRIEDDILVTATGPVNLTAGIPKTVDEVLRAIRS
jgi:Xaa-Pro aminopeptidase